MKQPTTQLEVLTEVLLKYHRWSILDQLRKTGAVRRAFRKAGIKLWKNGMIQNLPIITAAWHEAKTMLGRDLTKTELEDILGWAA